MALLPLQLTLVVRRSTVISRGVHQYLAFAPPQPIRWKVPMVQLMRTPGLSSECGLILSNPFRWVARLFFHPILELLILWRWFTSGITWEAISLRTLRNLINSTKGFGIITRICVNLRSLISASAATLHKITPQGMDFISGFTDVLPRPALRGWPVFSHLCPPGGIVALILSASHGHCLVVSRPSNSHLPQIFFPRGPRKSRLKEGPQMELTVPKPLMASPPSVI